MSIGWGSRHSGSDPFFLPLWGSNLVVAKARFHGLTPGRTREGDVPGVHTHPVDIALGGA